MLRQKCVKINNKNFAKYFIFNYNLIMLKILESNKNSKKSE